MALFVSINLIPYLIQAIAPIIKIFILSTLKKLFRCEIEFSRETGKSVLKCMRRHAWDRQTFRFISPSISGNLTLIAGVK